MLSDNLCSTSQQYSAFPLPGCTVVKSVEVKACSLDHCQLSVNCSFKKLLITMEANSCIRSPILKAFHVLFWNATENKMKLRNSQVPMLYKIMHRT